MNRKRVYTPLQTMEDLQKLYNEKKPTAKRVISLLSANPTPEAEQKGLCSLNGSDFGGLIQFLTGSNIILCETITVTFTTLEGKSRWPIVHTCGPSLELPSTYQCYSQHFSMPRIPGHLVLFRFNFA